MRLRKVSSSFSSCSSSCLGGPDSCLILVLILGNQLTEKLDLTRSGFGPLEVSFVQQRERSHQRRSET